MVSVSGHLPLLYRVHKGFRFVGQRAESRGESNKKCRLASCQWPAVLLLSVGLLAGCSNANYRCFYCHACDRLDASTFNYAQFFGFRVVQIMSVSTFFLIMLLFLLRSSCTFTEPRQGE